MKRTNPKTPRTLNSAQRYCTVRRPIQKPLPKVYRMKRTYRRRSS